MLAYAANRPLAGKRESSPNALLLVTGVHVAVLALVMSAKLDFPREIDRAPALISIPVPVPPPTDTNVKHPKEQREHPPMDRSAHRPPLPRRTSVTPLQISGPPSNAIEVGGAGGEGDAQIAQMPAVAPLHHDPHLLTPAGELKPPYPPEKLASEQEATLRLRLTIDARGGVTAVDPVGHADSEFLNSARRYILAHWRYDPASEGGQAIGSTIIVTLEFRLDS